MSVLGDGGDVKLDSVVAVLPVSDFGAAQKWYRQLFDRPADVEPMDGTAEWQIAENAWVQVSFDPAKAGYSSVVIGVGDAQAHAQLLKDAGISVGDVVEYPGVVRTLEVADPSGNNVVFVEELAPPSGT
jgi:hypothetical protein